MIKLRSTESESVCCHDINEICFLKHGIPLLVVSNNATEFDFAKMKEFSACIDLTMSLYWIFTIRVNCLWPRIICSKPSSSLLDKTYMFTIQNHKTIYKIHLLKIPCLQKHCLHCANHITINIIHIKHIFHTC